MSHGATIPLELAGNGSAPLAPSHGSATFRVMPESVSSCGLCFYKIQQRKWWGWSTIQDVLTKAEAEKAMQELESRWWLNNALAKPHEKLPQKP